MQTPDRKVNAYAFGSALATVIISVAVWLGAPDPPPLLVGALATVFGFPVAYFVRSPIEWVAPPGDNESDTADDPWVDN